MDGDLPEKKAADRPPLAYATPTVSRDDRHYRRRRLDIGFTIAVVVVVVCVVVAGLLVMMFVG